MARIRHCLAFLVATGLALAISGVNGSHLLAAEKFKYTTSVRMSINYQLPYYTAVEKGFWKDNGLEAEIVPFRGGTDQLTAVVAGDVFMGVTMTASLLPGIIRGVPVVIVAELVPKSEFYFWARTPGRFKEIADLKKGPKVGVHRFGTAMHAYSRAVAKELGVEKDIKIVATGGVVEAVAALKTGAVDMITFSIYQTVKLVAAGQAFPLVRVSSYLPKEWLDHVVFSRQDFVKTPTAKRAITSILQSVKYIQENPAWSQKRMKEILGLTDEEVAIIMKWEGLPFTKDGKVQRKGLENVLDFMIKYELLPKGKIPPVDEFYSRELTG